MAPTEGPNSEMVTLSCRNWNRARTHRCSGKRAKKAEWREALSMKHQLSGAAEDGLMLAWDCAVSLVEMRRSNA